MANEVDLKSAAAEAGKLLSDAIDRIAKQGGGGKDDPSPRLFFPTGIQLIHLQFKAAGGIDITFKVAGDKNATTVPVLDGVTAG